MTIVRRPSPFGERVSLRQAMDRLFEDSFVRTPTVDGQSSKISATPSNGPGGPAATAANHPTDADTGA